MKNIKPLDGILWFLANTLRKKIIIKMKNIKKLLRKNKICNFDIDKFWHFNSKHSPDSTIANKSILSADPLFTINWQDHVYNEFSNLKGSSLFPNPAVDIANIINFFTSDSDPSAKSLSLAMNKIAKALSTDFQTLAQIYSFDSSLKIINSLFNLEINKFKTIAKNQGSFNPKDHKKYLFWLNKFNIKGVDRSKNWIFLKNLIEQSSIKNSHLLVNLFVKKNSDFLTVTALNP